MAAYEVRISVWISDVCSSALPLPLVGDRLAKALRLLGHHHRLARQRRMALQRIAREPQHHRRPRERPRRRGQPAQPEYTADRQRRGEQRSEEHTSELQSLMRLSYAVFCLKKKNTTTTQER